MSEASTVDAREAAHFGGMAAEWWNPKGSSAMLHRLNPPRLAYLRARIDAHWGGDAAGFTPLAGKRALDVGCGAGLLAEPLARLGAAVTGVDASAEVIAAARAHAVQSALPIEYRIGGIEAVGGERFDLVTSLEVIEHVADTRAFVAGLAAALAQAGLLVLSTPNRTPLSRLALIGLAEGTGRIPRGTHDWNKFLTPPELTALLKAAGLQVVDIQGLAYSPAKGFVLSDSTAKGFVLSDSTALDYFVTAIHG